MVAFAENLTVNEYTAVGGTGYTYDANGNLTSDGTYSFEYDAFNRLVRVKQAATTVAEYVYDAANRRIRKTVGYEEYQYVYGGWQVLEEYYSVPAKEYFDNLYRRFTYGEYIDEPVVMECDKNLDGDFADTNEVVYYAQNNTYNVAALFDANGAIVEHYKYDPYGKVEIYTGAGVDGVWFTSDDVSSSVSAVGNPYTFTGRRLDTETGLMYFRNRYYSVDLGRFISRDALEYVDGWNLYRGYFAVNGMDAYGEDIWVENTTAVGGWHRRICVDICTNGSATGKYCISFGVDGQGEGGSSADGGSSDTDSSDSSDGSSGPEGAGTVLPGGIQNPNGNGIVYEDMTDQATKEVKRYKTNCCQSKNIKKYLKSLVGTRGNYAVIFGKNCRDFSEDTFNEIVDSINNY